MHAVQVVGEFVPAADLLEVRVVVLLEEVDEREGRDKALVGSALLGWLLE